MYIYTVKLQIEKTIKDNFINYLNLSHLNEVVATGCFTHATLEIDTTNDEIIVRYLCNGQEHFDNYITNFSEKMRNDTLTKFPIGIIKIERKFCKIICE